MGSTITWNGFGLESGLDWNVKSDCYIFINFTNLAQESLHPIKQDVDCYQ